MKIYSKNLRNVYYYRIEFTVYLSDHAGRFMELPQQLTGMKSAQKLQVSSVEEYGCRAACGTHQNIRQMAAKLITWIPLGIFSQVVVLGWACKQKAKSCPKNMVEIFLEVWSVGRTSPGSTWFLWQNLNSLLVPPADSSWDVEARAEGGHSLNSQDPFQVYLKEYQLLN